MVNKKRVLITYATYGSGHKSVAEYVYDYLSKFDNYEVKMIDIMDYNSRFGSLSKKMFYKNFENTISSKMFTLLYDLFDNKYTTTPYKEVTKSLFKNKILNKEIIDFNPDILISSHFFGNIVVGMLNKKKLINTKIITIITDYESHEMWSKDDKNINAYVVSNDIVKNELVNKGINPNKIYPFGIPLRDNFRMTDSITNIKRKYGINNELKTFLFFAGGSAGTNQSFRLFKALLKQDYDINIIYVCGKNEYIREKAIELVKKLKRENVKVLGFSTEVNNLLGICDVVITKPGGLSITEALEMKKPMILTEAIIANEEYNARFVSKNGYGVYAKTRLTLIKAMNKILCKRNYLSTIQKNVDMYSDNKSVEKIYKLMNEMLKK